MNDLTKINENEYLATDPVTGGTWRVVGPQLSPETVSAAIVRQIEDTGARPARGEAATIQFQIRIAEDRAAADRPA